jgi:hypothetical protein
MYCPKCGATAEEHYRYCSKCGYEMSGVAKEAPSRTRRNMATHITVLGWLFVVTGILTGLTGFVMVFAGQILRALPIEWPNDVPFDMSQLFTLVLASVGFVTIAIGVGTFMAGYGLLQYKPWARILTIITAIVGLVHFPLGTAVGIYALWALLSEEGREFYESKASIPFDQTLAAPQ